MESHLKLQAIWWGPCIWTLLSVEEQRFFPTILVHGRALVEAKNAHPLKLLGRQKFSLSAVYVAWRCKFSWGGFKLHIAKEPKHLNDTRDNWHHSREIVACSVLTHECEWGSPKAYRLTFGVEVGAFASTLPPCRVHALDTAGLLESLEQLAGHCVTLEFLCGTYHMSSQIEDVWLFVLYSFLLGITTLWSVYTLHLSRP